MTGDLVSSRKTTGSDRAAANLKHMARQIEPTRSGKPSLIKRGVAALVLVAIAAIAIELIIHVIATFFWIIVAIAVVAAVLWAANTLL